MGVFAGCRRTIANGLSRCNVLGKTFGLACSSRHHVEPHPAVFPCHSTGADVFSL